MLKNAGMPKSSLAANRAGTMLQAFSIIVCVCGGGSVVGCEKLYKNISNVGWLVEITH